MDHPQTCFAIWCHFTAMMFRTHAALNQRYSMIVYKLIVLFTWKMLPAKTPQEQKAIFCSLFRFAASLTFVACQVVVSHVHGEFHLRELTTIMLQKGMAHSLHLVIDFSFYVTHTPGWGQHEGSNKDNFLFNVRKISQVKSCLLILGDFHPF